MKVASVGIMFVMARALRHDEQLVSAAIAGFTDKRWKPQPTMFSSLATPGRRLIRRPGRVVPKELPGVLGDALRSPDVERVSLRTRGKTYLDFQSLDIETVGSELDRPLPMCQGQRGFDDSSLKRAEQWLAIVLDLASSLHAITGCVPVFDDSSCVLGEVSLGGVLDQHGRLLHPFPDQHERTWEARAQLGTRYMRFPRWGTIISHEHVEALGGRARIEAAVQPAVVRDLGAAWYFQLTESLETAMSTEALDKQRIFTELAAPLLPPPIPKDT